MQKLGMPGSEIIFKMVDLDKEVRLNGAEDIKIHVKTNAGQDFKPLNKVASGGELSRVSLALSVSGSNTELTPSVVFDEVDVYFKKFYYLFFITFNGNQLISWFDNIFLQWNKTL